MKNKVPKLHLLLHSADLVEEKMRIQLVHLDVKPRQARVLDALDRMGSVSQVVLARECHITPASMSTMISRLAAAGLITAETDPAELRSKIIGLSEQGGEVLEKVRGVWRDVDLHIEEAIGRDKALMLAELTGELRDALGGRAPWEG